MYQALYRKYRPIDFSSVVGQESIIKTLENSIVNNTFSHAYMFFGPRGTGKTTVSKIFARNINCLSQNNGLACGTCPNCLHSFEKECVDIIEIDAASNNGVDEIRELKNKISLVPSQLKFKVYIIDEVHMLSLGAFNALLKTLEEPPEHAIFILATTDPQKVPETIISRCQCFSFKRISNEKIIERLKYVCCEEKIDIDDRVLEQIAVSSAGGMRDSLGMLDKLRSFTDNKITLDIFAELNGMITESDLELLCDSIFNANIKDVLSKINLYNSYGKNLIQIFTQTMYYLRNLVVDYYINEKECKYSIDLMLKFINLINETMFDVKKSDNPKIYLEIILIKFINENILNINKTDKIISREIISQKPLANNANNVVIDMSSSEKIENKEEIINDKLQEKSSSLDEEYDFNDYFEEDTEENNYENEHLDISDNIEHTNSVVSNSKILNIKDIISVRVNNTFAKADKNLLKNEMILFQKFNDFTFDQEIGYIACNLLDSNIRVVSDENVVISFEYESTVDQNLLNLDKIIDVYKKITNSSKNIAIISDKMWEICKNEYIKKLKNGEKYEIIDEPEPIFEEVKMANNNNNSAVKLFGDIVEIE